MPDEQMPPDDPTAPTPTPVPPPEVPPETGAAVEEPDDDDDDAPDKTVVMVRKAISSREIEMLLVELAKRRAIELLDTASDHGMASKHWYLGGVSTLQVVTVRRWIERFAAPAILNALAEQIVVDKAVDKAAAAARHRAEQD